MLLGAWAELAILHITLLQYILGCAMEVSLPPRLDLFSERPTIDQTDQMDIDMDIDLGPIDDKDTFQPVRSCTTSWVEGP